MSNFELRIPLDKLSDDDVPFPTDFGGTTIDFTEMWVEIWGGRAGITATDGEKHNYRLYPLEHNHEPGVYIFGIKEDMTPQCYDPSVCIELDTKDRTYRVSQFGVHWESMMEDLEPGEMPVAIFSFC